MIEQIDQRVHKSDCYKANDDHMTTMIIIIIIMIMIMILINNYDYYDYGPHW